MAADAFFEKTDVFMEHMGQLNPGRIKLTDSNLAFKNSKTGKLENIPASSVEKCLWARLANQNGLKIVQKEGPSFRFGGFNDEQDFEKLKSFIKGNWHQELTAVDQSVRGWNYGQVNFEDQDLIFKVHEKEGFEVPLANVSNCTAAKNEVVMEFHQNEECPVSLMEMRFHIPTEMAEGDEDPVEEFKKQVLKFAGVVEDTDRPLVTLDKLLCATPRGRYDFKIFPNHLSLHGSTYDYKIPVKTILRMFLLPHKDGQRMFFVVSLDPPLRQGQTRYPYLVVEFTKDDEVDLEMGISEEQLKEKYNGKLQKNMQGPVYEVLSRIMRILLNQRITVPGSFVGHSGTPAVSCSYKQAAGFLYPLEKGFMYVHKPPMYIRFEEVGQVNFARSDVTTKSFDFEIDTRQGSVFQFNGIEKDEYTRLYDFVTKKNLRVRNAGKQPGQSGYNADDMTVSSDEEEPDPYREKLKREARHREEEEEESDSEDEDSDYNPTEDKKKRKEESSGSDSEPDLEYDSDAASPDSDASGSAGDDSPKKKKKPAKAKTVKERKPRKEKKKKPDDGRPKRGTSAYMFWLSANRASLTEKGMSVTEVAKKAGEEWKKLTDKSSFIYVASNIPGTSRVFQKWEAMAKKDKERYDREMEAWKKSGGPSTSAKKGGSKKSPTKSPSKQVKSAEFVKSSSSSDDDDDDKPLASNKKKDDSDEEEESGGGDSSGGSSDSD